MEVGQHGELVARGANVMQGYWNDYGRYLAVAFRDGVFRTGDVGYQDSEGYFYILDHLKDMIVTGGENVLFRRSGSCHLSNIPRFVKSRQSSNTRWLTNGVNS